MNRSRRAFLTSAAAASTVLAGCLGGDDGGENGASGTGGTASTITSTGTGEESQPTSGTTATDSESTTAPGGQGNESTAGTTNAEETTAATNLDHPAANALASQPFLGPTPGAVPTIVAFEDPSCHNCERFNTNTFPELESKLVDSGKASYVYRNFPYAFEWGRPAMAALEATYARNEGAFWSLKKHYFATQSEFDEGNVLDRTKEFLASETSLDAAAVIGDVESGRFERNVQRDIDAGESAGVVSTPTFFLFRDGQFLTEIRGAQSYQVFEQALGV